MASELSQKFTAEDVLNIFIEEHRLLNKIDPLFYPDAELTFASDFVDLCDALDLLPYRSLYAVLNRSFNISASKEDWKPILALDNNLFNICNFIATHSQCESITAKKLFTQNCLRAAVFLDLKEYLSENNIDVSDLRPSTLIVPYFEKHFGYMLDKITKLSKGKRVFELLNIKRKKGGFFNYINIFDSERYTYETGDIRTFRDLTLKIIEVNS